MSASFVGRVSRILAPKMRNKGLRIGDWFGLDCAKSKNLGRVLFLFCLQYTTLAYSDSYKFVDGTGEIFYASVTTPKTRPGPRIRVQPTYSLDLPFIKGQETSSDVNTIAMNAASAYGLDPQFLRSVILAESSNDPTAISPKGAIGLMQLMPATIERFGVNDPFDPAENIQAGAKYLSHLLNVFNSDFKLALAAYNAGENNVRKHGMQVPPFPETQQYITRVMGHYRSGTGLSP